MYWGARNMYTLFMHNIMHEHSSTVAAEYAFQHVYHVNYVQIVHNVLYGMLALQ